ncbi:tektin-like protein 1 [Branchiostoma floridae x Branchiostoma japonicum]
MAVTTRGVLPMATATIGPDSWRDATVRGIKVAQKVVDKSEKGAILGKQLDPLPTLRDNCAVQSNTTIHKYVREVRMVVVSLREYLLDTNEEIKSLIRGKEALEKALEHRRKDILLNQQSTAIRLTRPPREKILDGADELLHAELKHLLKLKKTLEAQLRETQKHLQELDGVRKLLTAVIQERSHVMDLITHAVSSVTANGRLSSRREGRYSRQEEMRPESPSNPMLGEPDPMGPYTPDAAKAIEEAREANLKSAALRRAIKDSIDKTTMLQQAAHRSVNDGLTQKLAETITMTQHLQVSSGENRAAMHRAQRWYDTTDKARTITMGPVSSSDLTTRERLDRPLVRVYQRHPGNQLPETHDIISGQVDLLKSLKATSRNLGLLHLARMRLRDDIRDKKVGADVDAHIVRLRRRRGNHRWVMEGSEAQIPGQLVATRPHVECP